MCVCERERERVRVRERKKESFPIYLIEIFDPVLVKLNVLNITTCVLLISITNCTYTYDMYIKDRK